MDQLLIESGLFGRGLVRIDTPEGVSRYNEALSDLGIEPTGLSTFGIDGVGWSPEIAAERGRPDYLGHGFANQVAIVASPDQENRPIHYPAHSAQRRLMWEMFQRYKREIADITTSTCLRIDQEQQIVDYTSPCDLFEIESVTVLSSAGGLIEAAKEQRSLVAALEEGDNWMDTALRARIMQSGARYGDLSRRHIDIAPYTFQLPANFWSRAFGGMFVLRFGRDSVIVVEDEAWLEKIKPQSGDRYEAFAISQRDEIIECLMREKMVEFDVKRFKENSQELDALAEYLMLDFVCRCEPDCDYKAMRPSKRKSVMIAHKSDIPEIIGQLDSFRRAVSARSGNKELVERASLGLQRLLTRPSERNVGATQNHVLWMLLLKMQEDPPDLLGLYTHDKERFFALFNSWPLSKRRWAAKFVSEHYKPEMDA
ncbi:MAG TPA: DUF6638 family protein [Candidatus Paceibacterota bacterium]